jgi:hypothetical protein
LESVLGGKVVGGNGMSKCSAGTLEELQERIDDWLVYLYGNGADRWHRWFDVRNGGCEGVLDQRNVMRLIVGLLQCPHCTYHVDIHPMEAKHDVVMYNVYTELADWQ